MTTNDNKGELDRLSMVVEAHGANPARWPKDEAQRLLAIARSTAVGRQLLNEAAALDHTLAQAPGADLARFSDLIDRIVEQTATGTGQPFTAEIVPLPVRARRTPGAVAATRPRHLWPIFGALAASLLIGFYVGASDLASPALQQVAGVSQDESEVAATNPGQSTAADEGQEGELL